MIAEHSELTRRQLLKAGAVAGASALTLDALGAPLLGSPALGATCHSRLDDIEHIVILMQENRSFDQFFGSFPGVRGFADQRNRDAFFQLGYHGRGSDRGRLLPFHMDGRRPLGQCLGDISVPTHNWIPQHLSWNGGRNNRFYEVHSQSVHDGPLGRNVLGYYDERDIPYFRALARAYTLCDMYFCSVIGPTEPNRLYSVSGTLDPDGRAGGPCLATHFGSYGLSGPFRRPGVYHWTTMPEQLEARGISWKSYTQGSSGSLDNPFPAFRQFFRPGKLNRLGVKPQFPGDFEADLARGEFPAVSWVQVSFSESEHPGFPPAAGEYAVDQVLRAIWRHPRIWRKTAVLIPHDENGGFFDHVPPPVAPKGTKGEWVTVKRLPPEAGNIRGPIGLGFRVPCTIVSPWTRGGFVCSDTFDHTSMLRLIERRFGAEVPNLSAWRRSVTGDLTSAFNFAAAPDYSVPHLPTPPGPTAPVITTGACSPRALNQKLRPYPVPARIPFPRQQAGRARRPSGPC